MPLCQSHMHGHMKVLKTTYTRKDAIGKDKLHHGVHHVKSLQVNFGTLDFKHLYDLHRWKFLRTVGSKSMYWANFVKITDLQYHVCIDLADAYFQDSIGQCHLLMLYIVIVVILCDL